MEQCNAVEMRKNLEIVEVLKSKGIDFVAIPVGGDLDKNTLIEMMKSQLNVLLKETE